MRRGHNDHDIGNRAAMMVGALALAGVGVVLLWQLGTIRRYVGMRRMSARRHPTPPGTMREAADTPPRWGTSHWPMH
ncbi:MAG: hypothetical protein JWM53_4811 [bacterium]|nr:hypothetical protein [bacterium]